MSVPQTDREMGPDPILELFLDGRAIDEALKRAVREALIRHKKLGESVAVWQDGKAVVLPPEEIPY
jgi:hypothetical protein